MTVCPLTILVAEDDEDDQLLLKEAFSETDQRVEIEFASDGIDLVEKLHSEYVHRERLLIVLDLNMPRMNGLEVIRELRAHPTHRTIPIVVLSTSSAPSDIEQAYQLGANTFFTKSLTFTGLVDIVEALGHYWGDLAKFTHSPSPASA